MANKVPADASLPKILQDKLITFKINEQAKPYLLKVFKEGRPEYADAIQKTFDQAE